MSTFTNQNILFELFDLFLQCCFI